MAISEKKSLLSSLLLPALILAVAGAGVCYWLYTEESKARQALGSHVNQLQTEKAQLSVELNKTKSDLTDVESQLDKLTDQLNAALTRQKEAEQELQQKTGEMTQLQAVAEDRIAELESDLKMYANFSRILAAELRPIKLALLGEKAAAGSYLQEPDQKRPFSKVTFKTIGSEDEQTTIDIVSGKITSINKKYGFIVTNIGSVQGAASGRTIELYRKDEVLGVGLIERTTDQSSVAAVVSEDVLRRINPGDKVVLI
ncbi:MAG: hypothetical protein COV74_08285 [Candidatus Omnitrophica bacterium CG11_big_fil_rev_8_21_14_0_20_45_26]|uniref:Uncharacterized protein n=1 Tax=Candidatus Abzuiibacterium crystallinum TaxID=1974748 RepID=A0A2H0LM92_9BACT|nr:MAG: hypothetical protein COV74_08285 [Candidatus Omnitrophica bacterium CG11_big_fil_rev_8_21_14_0_20_45_26]PIW63659.1 MAG: hypothetical protein COW12_09170 [Candidatus Omnitrophica bacterium CG12_big_fil_rev_8_21_14_0_65_45_16]